MLETRLCPTCGTAVNPASRFCPNCGSDLQAATPAVASTPEASAPPTAEAAALAPAHQAEPTGASSASPEPRAAEPAAAVAQAAAVVCFQHPTVAATRRCASCAVPICSTCDFVVPAPGADMSMLQIGRDMHLCPNCMSARQAGTRPATQVVPLGAGIMCSRHAEVSAVRRCNICHTPMCQTCDFELPGYFHVCPGCATTPTHEMSSGRKRNLILSYILVTWSTLGLALLFGGALAGLIRSKSDQEAIGVIFSFLVFVPSIAGTALAVSARDRKLANPPSVWVAVIWNSIILAILIILTVIGNLS